MKNNKRMLSLFMAVAMTVSAFSGLTVNAAETVETLDPVGATYINSTNADVNYSESGDIYANFAKPKGEGWEAAGGEGMDVGLVQFDASAHIGKIIGATVTLTSTCTTAGKNSEVNIASVNTDWDATTVTWNTAQTQAPSKLAAMGYAGDAGAALSADVSDYVMADEDGVLAFAFYTSTGRQQKITDVKLNLTVTDSVKTTYNIEYLDTEGNVIKDAVTKEGFADVEYTAETEDMANFYVGEDYYVYQGDLSTTTITAAADGSAGMTLVYKKLTGAILVEDFGSISDTWGFTTTTGVSVSDAALTLCSTNGSAKTDTKDFDESVSSLAAAKVSFKWKTTADLSNSGGNRRSEFMLKDKDGNIIFTMSGATNRGGIPTQVRYQVGGAVTTASTWITSNNDWYSIDLTLDFLGKTLMGTISNGGTILADIPKTTIPAANLAQFAAQNHSSLAPMAIDDVIITKADVTPVTFVVTSSQDTAPVADAVVTVGAFSVATDAEGKAVMEMPNGTFDVAVEAPLHRNYTGTVTVDEATTEAPITMEYVGETAVNKIVIAGGDEAGIYKPATGENKTVNPYTVTIYNEIDQEMEDETVTWSIVDAPEGASIDENGIVTVTDAIQFADINGTNLTIRATSVSKPDVYAEVVLHVFDVAAVTTFDIAGAYAVKDGSTVTYSVANIKDQYGVAMTTESAPVLTASDAKIAVDGMTITPATGVTNEQTATITVTLDGATATKDIIVYGYDFYEPGTPVASIGSPRMEDIAGQTMIVWPASSSSSTATYSMVFPEPVALEKGSSKKLTYTSYNYDKSGAGKDVTVQERRLNIKNSAGTTLVTFGLANGTAYLNATYNGNSGISASDASWIYNGQSVANEEMIVFTTDMAGLTKATIQINGGETYTFEVGTDIGDIAQLDLFEGKGAPSDRMHGIMNVKITNSDIVPVEINGDDYISKIAGGYATKQYEASIFAMEDGETFTWSVTPVYGGDSAILSEVKYGATLTPSKTGDAVVVIATYEGGRLVSMASEPKAVTEGEAITVEAAEGAKVMLWNSLAAQEPMAAAATSVLINAGEPTTPPIDETPVPSDDDIYITQDGVLHVKDTTTATAAEIKFASDIDSTKVATKVVEIRDYAKIASFDIEGPAAISAGESGTYSVANIVDEYGDTVDMAPAYAITTGADIATIDAATGVMTTTGTGTVVVSVTLGNPGKELTLTKEVVVANFYYINEAVAENEVVVDVASLANYNGDTEYYVTTAADGKVVNQYTTKSTDGKVTVDTTGATALEVAPVYSYINVGDIADNNPLSIPLPDGLYDFTFTKANGTRGDIYVNGKMVGNNVDQYGADRATSGSTYSVADIVVSGGSANVTMKNNTSSMSTVSAKKAPSIIERKQHLYILGDSLVATYYGTFEDADGDGTPAAGKAQTGWGQVLDKFINTDAINVTNLAESGNYAEGLYGDPFHGVLANAKAGDILLFECGYNDRNYPSSLGSDSARYENMKNYMELAYNDAKAIGVEVIFVTPNASVHGTGWKASVQGTGHVIDKAAELGAKCIDLSSASYAYYSTTKATVDESKTYTAANFCISDSLHSTYHGAMKNAEIVASAMLGLDTTAHMVDTTASYDLVDTEGNMIVVQAKAAE